MFFFYSLSWLFPALTQCFLGPQAILKFFNESYSSAYSTGVQEKIAIFFSSDYSVQQCSGFGSIYLYGSGSLHQQAKNLEKPRFPLFCDFFMTFYLWKNDVNVPSTRNKYKKNIFSCVLKVTDEKNRIRIRIRTKMSRIPNTAVQLSWQFFICLRKSRTGWTSWRPTPPTTTSRRFWSGTSATR